MNNRSIFIIIAVVLISFCCLPIGISALVLIIQSIDNPALSEGILYTFMLLLCCVPVTLGIAALALQLRHTFRSRVAAQRLAAELGLRPINEASSPMATWYGGVYRDHPVVIKVYGSTYRYYSSGRSRTGVNFLLQISMEVKVPQPLDVVVFRDRKGASKNPANFEEAFESENAERLNENVRQALFEFVNKGYRTGFTGVTYRFNKGTRNVRLRDRASAPEGLLAPEVLPGAHVVLIHNHPDTSISADELRVLLEDMFIVVQAVEDQYI